MPDLLMYSHFLDSLEEGVLFLSDDLKVLASNQAARSMLANGRPHLLGLSCAALFTANACAQGCSKSGRCSLLPEAGEGRRIQDVFVKNPDGSERALRMWSTLTPNNDSGVHCTITLRDCSRERELEAEVRNQWQLGGLIGRSLAMQELYQKILRAAASDASVLISGESGVGKELAARALHDNSARASGPYVTVHCAALPDTLQEAELFGHARGAFSGATSARVGRFEAADGGTVFLDEIGEISAATQVRLLRVVQEREIVRIGENTPRKVDVRIIAATHRNLEKMVAEGLFRADLYYRLCVLPLGIAPLRQRREDIPLLAGKMLATLAGRYSQPRLQISPAAMQRLESYDWPGNVRQLFNCLEYAAVHGDGSIIHPENLPPEIGAAPPETAALAPPVADAPPPQRLGRSSPDEEKDAIAAALSACRGNKAAAARQLGISRTTLWQRLKQYPELAGGEETPP